MVITIKYTATLSYGYNHQIYSNFALSYGYNHQIYSNFALFYLNFTKEDTPMTFQKEDLPGRVT